jgi:hypothetical protein
MDEYFALADNYNLPDFRNNFVSYASLQVDEDRLKDYLLVAEKLDSQELYSTCFEFALWNIGIETIVDYFALALRYNHLKLRDECCKFGSSLPFLDATMERFFLANDESLLASFRDVCEKFACAFVKAGTVEGECLNSALNFLLSEYLDIADRYEFPFLRKHCLTFLFKDVKDANIEIYMGMARKRGWTELYDFCVNFAMNDVKLGNFVRYVEVANNFGLEELRNKCMDVMLKGPR